ncbi:Spc97 Spc98 family [Podospora australis]|uniref:Spc97 Spc98 family n=1 Tax=Podospora australis TaxID=1536484 RepID=A0AAN6X201_9PEZI|nr:Spc97 Spc98 family [Podospora australis]
MASGHNDPRLLYAINGVKAYHIANGKEEPLTPAGPQTLSLLMVPTSSVFADPSIDAESAANAEQDFYLHLHLPPELDLPLPATTQIYHKPPTSYLIPRWDLGPDSGAFTRIEFPSAESRKGIQEDVDTFETILAQCTAFLERAPPPKFETDDNLWWDDKDLKGGSKKAATSSSKAVGGKSASGGEQLPAYNPADYKPGEAYAQGSHSSHVPGQIVLVDEEDGSVIGELTDGYQLVEHSSLKHGSKDPVEITLPADAGGKIQVAPISPELYEAELHPAYKNSFLVSNASAASRLIITGSDMVAKLLQGQADSYTKRATPAAKPMTFKPTTKEHIRRINTFTGGAASLSAKTVGQIGAFAQNIGASLGGHGKKAGGNHKGYGPDGKPLDTYKPGLLNKSMMAFSTVMDGVEQAGRNLLSTTSNAATTVVEHKWGPEAGDVSRSIGGGVKNVGLVYIDVTGVSRRAVIKSVAKGMVVGKTVKGEHVIVGGGDGGVATIDNTQAGSVSGGSINQQQLLQDTELLSGMTVVEGKQPAKSGNGNTIYNAPTNYPVHRIRDSSASKRLALQLCALFLDFDLHQNNTKTEKSMCCRFELLGTLILFLQDLNDWREERKQQKKQNQKGEMRNEKAERKPEYGNNPTSYTHEPIPTSGKQQNQRRKMLHEILLSLSGHPSPLLRAAATSSPDHASKTLSLSPPELSLLKSLASLSELHINLLSYTAQISSSHPSIICRVVAGAIESVHLVNGFQACVLEVESKILTKDTELVGAYDIVPLTEVCGIFEQWRRRLEWLWKVVQYMLRTEETGTTENGQKKCTGARLMDLLRSELQTGYGDVEDTARHLVGVAEAAWLKQVSAWVLYGRCPAFGREDFFVQSIRRKSSDEEDEGDEEWVIEESLLPRFVTPKTAESMLFIGRSLNQIRAKSLLGGAQGEDHLSTQLVKLAGLRHPLDAATFSKTIGDIRRFLSRTTLQRLLPLTKVLETLQLLRGFFLLGRGEFAMALTQQADEKIRSRWKRAENLAYEKRDGGLGAVAVKEGEVAAVLARTWAAIGSMQGEHAEEDEGVELARDLLRLTIAKSSKSALPVPPLSTTGADELGLAAIAPTPFRNLLFSVPVVLTLLIPSPLDLFLSQADLQTYTAINSYLLSLRRAHLRLTDLWKITSLRRHHPAPMGPPRGSTRGGRGMVLLHRQRHTIRSNILRNAWATASAAIFFLGETEGYLQTEVVAGLSDGFYRWLTTGEDDTSTTNTKSKSQTQHMTGQSGPGKGAQHEEDDIWLEAGSFSSPAPSSGVEDGNGITTHDPQTLAQAHRLYLRTLVHRLLLFQPTFTDPLYELLVQIDALVALVNRLHEVWKAADLEADVGVVDAFVDLAREERDVQVDLKEVEDKVKRGIEGLIEELRRLEAKGDVLQNNTDFTAPERGEDGRFREAALEVREKGEYMPRRVGGIDRLLMKLDFGSWFGGDGERGGREGF